METMTCGEHVVTSVSGRLYVWYRPSKLSYNNMLKCYIYDGEHVKI